MNLILAILVAIIVFCGFLVVDTMRVTAKRRKSLRDRIAADGSSYAADHQDAGIGFGDELSPRATAILGVLRSIGIVTDEPIRELELRFARAGIESREAPIYYLFFQRIVSFIFGFIGLAIIFNGYSSSNLVTELLGAIVTVLAFFGPKLYLQNKIDHRTKTLQRAFPDTLDLLLICVESGLALDAALSRVCNELARAYPDMTNELNRTRLELSLLNDRVKALMNLGDRTGMVAFRSLVVALIQSERFGTSLTDTLRVLSEDFRLQRLATAEAKAARLPVLMTVPLIFLLMPAFMLIVLGPAIISFMHKGGALVGKK